MSETSETKAHRAYNCWIIDLALTREWKEETLDFMDATEKAFLAGREARDNAQP